MVKTYIIHVSDAFEREIYIKKQIANKELDCTFILDGDKKDLTTHIISDYFKEPLNSVSNVSSCAYKHILAYEQIVNNAIEFALILEDDISFYRNFKTQFNLICAEIKSRNIRKYIISLEDSNLQYVKKSKRIQNTFLYKKPNGRMAGAYLIDNECARNILLEIKNNKCFLPIDWFHNHSSNNNLISIYWSHPALAIQGSLNGEMPSMIDNKKFGYTRILLFRIQKAYKKILYHFL